MFLKNAVFHVHSEEISSTGNRDAMNGLLRRRTEDQATKTSSGKRIDLRKSCHTIRFQSSNVISTYKSEPCPTTSEESSAFARGLTF